MIHGVRCVASEWPNFFRVNFVIRRAVMMMNVIDV